VTTQVGEEWLVMALSLRKSPRIRARR